MSKFTITHWPAECAENCDQPDCHHRATWSVGEKHFRTKQEAMDYAIELADDALRGIEKLTKADGRKTTP